MFVHLPCFLWCFLLTVILWFKISDYPFGSPPVFSRVRIAQSLVFCVMFSRSLFVHLPCFLWCFLLTVILWFKISDYPFGSPPVFSRVRIAQSLVFCVMFSRSLFVHLPCFLWSLYYLSFFDSRSLIIPLVSSRFSYCRWQMSC